MEELLLPSGEEEARSDHSSCAPGHGGGTMGDRVKTLLRGAVKEDLKRNVRDFCKRNGLLTLSVIAVLTGCTLGFMLRGTQLSTQVLLTWGPIPDHAGARALRAAGPENYLLARRAFSLL